MIFSHAPMLLSGRAVVQVAQTSYGVDEDTGTVTVTLTKTGGTPCSVDYALNDGTAAAGTDYTDDSGTLTWTAGDNTPKTVDITIADRTGGQGTRDFTFDLSNPTDCTIGDAQATITIDDVFHLSDAVAAYDLQDAGSLWQDTAGTTAAGTGDPLGRIDDQSGNGNHLLQGTTAEKPTLQNDGTNYADFDGTDDWMSVSVASGGALTLGAAIDTLGGSGFSDARAAISSQESGEDNFRNLYGTTDSNVKCRSLGGGDTTILTLSINPAAAIAEYSGLSGDMELRANGSTTTGTKTSAINACNLLLAGRGRNHGSEFWQGRLYRAVAVNRILTSGEKNSLEQWLADGSGVTL